MSPPASPTAATVTERYLHAVTRRLPEDQRADVADELRATIADRIASLREHHPETDEAAHERRALEELGDPDRLAAGYSGRRLQLIGPGLYLTWARLLKLVLAIVVPTATLALAVIDLLLGKTIGEIAGGAVTLALTLVVHIAFWITVVFVLIERTAGDRPAALDTAWDIDQLPSLPERRGSLTDLIATLLLLALFAGAIVWQHVASPLGDGLPLLAPELWRFWIPLILVLLVAEAAFETFKYRTGEMTPPMATANVVLGALFAAPLAYLAASGQLLNPAAVSEIQRGWAGFDTGTTHTIVLVVVIAIWIWDSIEGWWHALRA